MEAELPLVEDVRRDLLITTWKPADSEAPPFSVPGATAYAGTGKRWTHYLITWIRGTDVRCDGAATNRVEVKGLIFRYTPELAQQALKLIKNGGRVGRAQKEA